MKRCLSAVGVLLCSTAGWLAAQQTAPPAEVSETIRSGTVEVLLDIAVRDKRGKQVKNLKPKDIEIYENGVKQEVRSFRLAGSDETRSRRAETGAATRKPEAAGVPLRAVNLLCIVFHSLDPVSRTRAMRAVDEMLRDELPQGVLAGVFTLDDHLVPIAPFTNRRDQVLLTVRDAFSGRSVDFDTASEAVLTANPNSFTVTALVDMASRSATITARVTGGEVSRSAITSADVSTGAGANALRGDRARERVDFANISGMRALDQVETMISRFSALPGRKSVLLFSTGLLTTGDPDRYDALLARANQGNITIYSIDPTELNETSDSQAVNIALSQVAAVSRTQTQVDSPGQIGGAAAARNRSRQGDSLEVAVRSSDPLAALRAIAEGTGGFLVAHASEYRKPFERVLEDMAAHYEVSYRPAGLRFDGRLRSIEVKVARENAVVESRTGYFALPQMPGEEDLHPYDVIGLAALGAKPPPAAFDFNTGVFAFGRNPAARKVALAFEVPGSNLVASMDEAQTTARVHFSLVALVKNNSGEVVDKYSVDAPFEFAAANVEALKDSAITYAHPFHLAPGRYSVETAVIDREGGRMSARTLEFDVSPPARGLAISPAMLVQRVEPAPAGSAQEDPLVYQGQRVVPMVSPELPPSAKPFVYFVVYPDPASNAKPSIRVDFLAGGKLLASQTSELPPPDASGTIPMMVSAALRPGLCELRISTTQEGATATSSVRYFVGQSR